MTPTIPDVENWNPEQLAAAGLRAATVSQGLDSAVGEGLTDTAALSDAARWSGSAGDAATTRMETEKTRASAVGAALLKLQTAFTSQVQNLVDARAKVLRLRDDALAQTPPFEVAANGTVEATARIAYLRSHADKANVETLVLQETLQAASRTWDLTNALKDAEAVADQAKTQVEGALGAVEKAFDGLGDPNTPAAPPADTAPAASGTGTPVVTSNPSSDKPSYVTSNHGSHGNSGSTSSTPHSSTPYSGSPSSSAPTGPMPTGDVAKWIAEAKQKLIEMGYRPEDIDESAIALIIQHESNGNPLIQNEDDSNAALGHPSKGLMQTIDSTFNAYRAPGHNDIWSPVDNIMAGVRYAIDRYGSLGNVPGVAAVRAGRQYVGY